MGGERGDSGRTQSGLQVGAGAGDQSGSPLFGRHRFPNRSGGGHANRKRSEQAGACRRDGAAPAYFDAGEGPELPGWRETNTVGLPYTLFNKDREPWNELKARQAVQLAVDVDTIVKTLYLGTYERAWSPLTPGTFGYDASLEQSIKPDIPKANRALDELGWVRGEDGIRVKDGKKLTLRYVDGTPNREKRNDIAVMIQRRLKQIGIAVEVEITKDIRTVVYTNGDYDLYGNSQVNSDPNALYSFYHSYDPNGQASLSRLNDPDVDQWLEQGRVEKDDTKRAELYQQVQHYIIDHAIILPIYVFPYTVATSNSVQGVLFDSLGYPLFNDVSLQNRRKGPEEVWLER